MFAKSDFTLSYLGRLSAQPTLKTPFPNTSTLTLTLLPSANFSGFPNLAVSGSNSSSSLCKCVLLIWDFRISLSSHLMGDLGTCEENWSISSLIILHIVQYKWNQRGNITRALRTCSTLSTRHQDWVLSQGISIQPPTRKYLPGPWAPLYPQPLLFRPPLE